MFTDLNLPSWRIKGAFDEFWEEDERQFGSLKYQIPTGNKSTRTQLLNVAFHSDPGFLKKLSTSPDVGDTKREVSLSLSGFRYSKEDLDAVHVRYDGTSSVENLDAQQLMVTGYIKSKKRLSGSDFPIVEIAFVTHLNKPGSKFKYALTSASFAYGQSIASGLDHLQRVADYRKTSFSDLMKGSWYRFLIRNPEFEVINGYLRSRGTLSNIYNIPESPFEETVPVLKLWKAELYDGDPGHLDIVPAIKKAPEIQPQTLSIAREVTL